MKESKFKEGDIIIKDNKFYCCDIAGEELARFKAFSEFGWFGANRGGCGGDNGTVKCIDYITLSVHRSKYLSPPETWRDGHMGCRTSIYPIVGKKIGNCGGYNFNLSTLRRVYPKAYKSFIKNQNKRFKKPKKK